MALLADRVAIVTGASKGIGRALSALFAREGARVVCAARSAALVEETAASIRRDGGDAIAVVADAAREPDVRAIVDAALGAFGKIDTLVNNAGDGGPTKPIPEYTTADWFYTLNSRLTRAIRCSPFSRPGMLRP